MTPKQITFARKLLRKIGVVDEADKEAFIKDFTNGRTTHVSELETAEMNRLVNLYGDPTKAKNLQQNKVLSSAHKLGWKCADGTIDMARVNQFVKRQTGIDSLNKVPSHLLNKLVSAIANIQHQQHAKAR